MRQFKEENGLDHVVMFWTANTERYSDIILASIRTSHCEVLPSTAFAVASILEGAPFVNGIPQNTFVPPPFHMVRIALHRTCGYHHICT